jgi:hypothetical protein
MPRTRYKKGQWNIIDDFTGFKKKIGELKRNYNGFMVDDKGWEERHPQETLRVRGDKQNVSIVRKEVDIFIEPITAEDL